MTYHPAMTIAVGLDLAFVFTNFKYTKSKQELTLLYRTINLLCQYNMFDTRLGSSVGRVSPPRSGGIGFDPGPRHTKVVNNGTSCSPLGTRIFGVGLGLVAPVSV